MTWDQFKNKSNLIYATKQIAALKFQEYIIRKLLTEDMGMTKKVSFDKSNNTKLTKAALVVRNIEADPDNNKYEWYVKWRRNNM